MILSLLQDSVAMALAMLLTTSAIGKLHHRASFLATLRAYDLIPKSLLGIFAVQLVAVEIFLALGLVFFRSSVVVIGATGLFIVYGFAMFVNIVRENTNIDCGCQHGVAHHPISKWMVIRNVLLAACGSLLLAPSEDYSFGQFHYAFVCFATIFLSFFYLSCNQLIANSTRMQGLFQ